MYAAMIAKLFGEGLGFVRVSAGTGRHLEVSGERAVIAVAVEAFHRGRPDRRRDCGG
jgi:hypothetical protein